MLKSVFKNKVEWHNSLLVAIAIFCCIFLFSLYVIHFLSGYLWDAPSFLVSDHLLKIIITITSLSLIYQLITVIVEIFDTGCHPQDKQNHCSGQSCVENLACQMFKGELTHANLQIVYPGQPRAGHMPWLVLGRFPQGSRWCLGCASTAYPGASALCERERLLLCFLSKLIWSQPGYLFWELNRPLLLIGHTVTLYKQSCFSNCGFVPR